MSPLRHKLVSDEASQNQFLARTLNGFAWSLGFVALATVLYNWLSGHPTPIPRAALAFVAAFAAWHCARTGRVQLGLGVLLTTIGGLIGIMVYDGGGVDSPYISAAAILVVLAGCMFGPRWVAGSTIVLAIALLGLAYGQANGVLALHDPMASSPYRRAFLHLQTLVLLGGLCWYVFGRMQEQITQLQHAHAELADRATRLQRAQLALEEDEQRFQDYIQAAGDWFWETDAQGRFTWMSPSVKTVTGVTPEWHYGKTRVELTAPEYRTSEAWRQHEETLRRHEPFRDFRYVRHSPQGEQWMSTSGVPRWGVHGEFLGYRGSGSDISNQVRESAEAARINALLRSAIEEIDETFVLCDPQDRILLANRNFRAMNPGVGELIDQGCTYADFLRLACAKGGIPEANDDVEGFIQRRQAQRLGPPGPPIERYRADGHCLLVRDRRLADGGTVTVGIDITERKMQERLLAASEKRLRDVLDNARGVAVQFYDETGRVVYWNNASEEVFGYSAQEMLGGHLDERMLSPELVAEWRHELATLQPHEPPTEPAEMTITHKNGSQRILLSNAFAIEEPDGKLRFACMDIDVTGRKLMEEELRASRRLLEQVIDAIPMAIFAKDTQSNYIMVNRYFADLYNTDKASVLRQHTSTVPLPNATRTKSLEDDQWVYENRRPLQHVLKPIATPNGQTITFHSSKIPLFDDDGKLTGLLGINRDITEELRAQEQMQQMNLTLERSVQQRTEQLTLANTDLRNALHTLEASQEALLQSEKLAALGRIVAGVAHELNTPIGNSLLSASTLVHQTNALAQQVTQGLRRSYLDQHVATVSDIVAVLLRNLERSAELIGSFKQLSADQASSQRREFDLKTVVDEVLLSHRPMLRSTHIQVQIDVPGGLMLDSYPGPLGQVLANLLSNAAVHGYEGFRDAGTVHIGATAIEQDRIELRITDQGRGIDPQALRRIFDPFYTTRLGKGGSGLGLHIVHNIVTGVLGGVVTVESTPDVGTCFAVRFPRVAPIKSIDAENAVLSSSDAQA